MEDTIISIFKVLSFYAGYRAGIKLVYKVLQV